MSMTTSLHTDGAGLMVKYEIPWNSNAIGLVSSDGNELSLHGTLENWWLLRKLPKAPGYFYSPSKPSGLLRDHAESDAAALEFYNAEKAKLEQVAA